MIELAGLAPVVLALATAVTLFAGLIKGMIGFGMPLVMVSGLSMVMEPKLGLAAMIIPVLIVNVIQAFRHGWAEAVGAVREFRRYLLWLAVAIVAVAQVVVLVRNEVFYLMLGIPIVVIAVIQLFGWRPMVPDAMRGRAEVALG